MDDEFYVNQNQVVEQEGNKNIWVVCYDLFKFAWTSLIFLTLITIYLIKKNLKLAKNVRDNNFIILKLTYQLY